MSGDVGDGVLHEIAIAAALIGGEDGVFGGIGGGGLRPEDEGGEAADELVGEQVSADRDEADRGGAGPDGGKAGAEEGVRGVRELAAEVLHGGESGRWSEFGNGHRWAGEGCEEGGIVEGIEMDVREEEGGDGLRGGRRLGAKGPGGEVTQCEDGERGRAARQATRLQRRNAGILPLRAAQSQYDSPSS